MKKVTLLLVLIMVYQVIAFSQPCFPDGISFTTQEQIDSFYENYPNCSEIGGSVFIEGNDITNLEGLFILQEIGGDLVIGGTDSTGTSLIDLYGLYYLTSIEGGLYVESNSMLTSLTGMNNLEVESLDILSINNNPLLSICDVQYVCDYLATPNVQVFISNNAPGCNDPSEVELNCENNCLPEGIFFQTQQQIDNFQANHPGCEEIMGMVTIDGNDISSLEGLSSLTTIHGRILIGELYPTSCNPNLTNLNGLENLTYIGGWLGINWNENLLDCSGLDGLNKIGAGLTFWGNENLTSLDGLINLTSIGKSLEIKSNPSLNNISGLDSLTFIGEDLLITYNSELTDLNGFNHVEPIFLDGRMIISANNLLTDIFGLEFFDPGAIDEMYISGNSSLSVCELQMICDYLADFTNIVEISNNASGCNSVNEVRDICNYCFPDGVTFSSQAQIDSFQIIYPECVHIEGNVIINSDDEISNLHGLNILTSIGGSLHIKDNFNLTSLSGLHNINALGGSLKIEGNTVLDTINGFSSLTTVNDTLWIQGNESLVNLSGLENVFLDDIELLHISSNPLLSHCEIQSVCFYLAWSINDVEIFNNAPGCNDQYEVMGFCAINVDDIKPEKEIFELYPNPTSKWLNIKANNETSYCIEIRNLFGQLVIQEKGIHLPHYSLDVNELKAGVYFYNIKGMAKNLQQGKLIIEQN